MLFLLLNLPSVQATDPGARWGQQAVYVDGTNQMYVVGGASSNVVSEVTNDVYILSLNDSATWSSGPTDGLPAHAFAAMALSDNKQTLTVAGGMTASCSTDAPVHTLDLSAQSWKSYTPKNFIRRHGAGAATVSNGTMVVGGLVDKYVCYAGTSGYAAYDVIAESNPNTITSTAMPNSLTGNKLAVSDFAMTESKGTIYLAGGQAADGSLVSFDNVAIWTESDGWTSKATTGQIPSGCLGGTLVAHPTLDLLILFGGATEVSTSNFAATSTVTLLNTTTWAWSWSRNLQPPSDTAVAYHSSVITPNGVMISAFGRGRYGFATNAVNYLDMRDPTGATWGWKSQWSDDMLDKFTPPAATAAAQKSKSNKGTIAAAVVPTVILLLILIPLLLWFIRRHMRNSRKRRLASHFSFSTQEDRGDFSRANNRYPFGPNGGYSAEGSLSSLSKRVMTVFRRGTKGVGDDGTINEGEMVQVVAPEQLTEKGNNWEEIDFGLGRIDAGRREASYTDLPARSRTPRVPVPAMGQNDRMPFPMPVASTITYAPEEPEVNQRRGPAVGELVPIDNESPRLGSPTYDGQFPLTQESGVASAGADAATTDASDWNMLEQSMMARPVFQRSPNSSLRSHAHTNSVITVPQPTQRSPRSVEYHDARQRMTPSPTPSIPPLQFERVSLTPGTAQATRRLAGGRRPTVSMVETPSTRARRGSANALGLSRYSAAHLHVANPSERE